LGRMIIDSGGETFGDFRVNPDDTTAANPYR
jgi:hypothetical protein